MTPSYPAVLAFHLLAVVLSAFGLVVVTLMLAAAKGPAAPAEWRRMAGWNRWVTTPALLAVWAAGLTLADEGGWLGDGWLHGKIACVALLTALHGWQSHRLRARARGGEARRLPRWVIAAPPVLLAAILYLVSVKPG